MTVLSWVAMFFGFIGLWIAGTRNVGWFITSVGSALWAIYSLATKQPALLFTSLAWWVTESRNYLIGRSHDKKYRTADGIREASTD